MKKGTIGKIFTIVVLLITALTMSKLFTKTSFGADNEERAIIEGNLDKYINYELSDGNKGTLVQYSLRTGIEYGDEFFAIKNSTLNVNLNQIDGKYPYDVKVIAKSTKVTNGKTNNLDVNYNYDSNTGNLSINVSNENENGEPIYNTRPAENDRDEFVIISYYDAFSQEKPVRELSCGVSYNATLFTEDSRQVNVQGALTKEVTDDFGDLTSVSTVNSDVYNGYIKSNIINGTNYDTEYTENNEILISNKKVHQKIYLTEENTFVNTNDIYYKSTKILKEDFLNVLGENGNIQILDGNSNVIASVDNNTFDENGEAIITYNDDVNKIIIKTSDILNEGILHIENVKKIKGNILNIEDKDITRKLTIVGANDKQIEVSDESNENNKTLKTVEEETYRAESENTIEVKDSQTSVDVNVDNTEWTNEKQNDVTFDVYLNSANESYNLFKNPTIRIELPSEVEKVVLGDSQVIYANGLTLTNTSVETGKNGNLNIVATLDGAQTQFSGNELKTDLKIATKIIIKKDIEDANEKINVAYTNQSTVNKKSEQGNIEKQIKIKAYNESKQENINGENIETLPNDNQTLGDKLEEVAKQQIRENVMPTATQSEIEGLNVTVNTTRGEDELNNGDIVYEGEFIKYSVQITNTTGSDINNVKIQASIPDGLTYGELEADYYSDRGNYQYNFENDTREKEINVGTIKAGETITKFYEVKVNDLADSENEKQVTSNIKTFIGNTQVNSYELSNTVKPAEVSGFLSAYLSGMKDRWAYELKVNNPENKEVTVKVTLPKYYQFEGIAYQWQYYPEDKIKVDGNVIEFTVNDSEPYTILGNMDSSQVKQDFDTSKVELKAYATLSIDGEEYKTNENRILFEFETVSVKMTSDNEGEKVNYGDAINYHISITNTGRTNYRDENNSELYNVVSVRLTDYLPENVNPVSVTYEKYEIADEETGALASEKTIKTEDISGEVTDENGNKLPNVDLSFTIPYGETINVYIQTTAGYVYEETNVQNSVTVQSDMVKTKTSNIITHTILPANNSEGGIIPDPGEEDTTPPTITGVEDGRTYNNYVTPIAQDENLASVILIKDGIIVEDYQNGDQITEDGSYTLTASDEAGNSTQVSFIIDTQGGGEEPGGNTTNDTNTNTNTGTEPGVDPNPDDPNKPQESGYSIKGVVWEDQNGDGSRQSSEQLINGIQVMLVDLSDSSRVKANTRTTNGQYSFQNLEQGQYVVVFRYDTSIYKITDYKKNGVSESSNSDAISQTITLDGQRVEAGVTDILNLSQDLDDIDIGLIGIQQQNLKVDKYISNITLQTNARTNQYTYDNSKLAKIDVRAKEIQGAVVTVTYNIVVTNQGKNATTVDEIIDYVPEGLSFTQQGNTNWTQESGNQVVNRSLSNQNIAPGESRQVTLTLTKTLNENGTGTFTNRAEINVDDVSKDDNSSSADLIISVSTGAIVYIGFGMLGLVILIGIMFLLVKFKVLNIRKIGKLSLFLVIFGAMILSQVQYVCAFDKHTTFINIGNQSPDFSGGPYNAGGKCIDHGIWAYSGGYTAFNGSYWVTRWENVTNRDDISINLRKLNNQIGIKKLGNDYLVGPFQVKCSYSGGYDFWAYDRNGNEIQPGIRKTTTDENGNFKWVGGSATFYLKFSANDLKNGISRIKMSTTRTGNERVTHYAWGFGHYDYDGVPTEGGQAQRVIPNHEQRFNFGDEGNFSYETNTTISNTASVEWTNFSSTLDITKVDYDDQNVRINIEGTLTKNDGSYSQHFATTNGQVHFDNLTPGSYTITETINNAYGYEKNIGKKVHITVGKGALLQVTMTNIDYRADLRITKEDQDTKEKLANVGFKMQNSKGQYVIAVNQSGSTVSRVTGSITLGNMQFTSNVNQATEFITDSNGELVINDILVDRYTITETSNNNGYGYSPEIGKQTTITIKRKSDNQLTFENIKHTGNLKIVKQDYDTKETMANVGFKLQTDNKDYVIAVDLDGKDVNRVVGSITLGNMKYTSDESKATEFVTGDNGELEINEIMEGNYIITETTNNYYGYREEVGKNTTITIKRRTDHKLPFDNIKHTGNLKLVKQDYDTKKALAGVSFKIRNSKGQYVIAVDDNGNTQSKVTGTIHLGDMQFTTNENSATEFITDDNGEINVYNILVDTYTITETAINTEDYGYEIDANYIFWINGQENGEGTTTTVQVVRQTSDNTADTSSDKNNSITYQNRKKYFRLSGRVWEDMIDGKVSYRNNTYDQDVDKNVANVTVRLKDRNGNTVPFKNAQGEQLEEVLTNSEGYYEMWDILIDDIDNYYIEFTYNGMSYTNVAIDNILDANSSKAMENTDDRTEFNESFAEITYDQGTTGQAKNTQGEDTYKLTYDEGDYSSTLNYGPNSVYGYDGQRFPVNYTQEQYIITADTREAFLSKGNNYSGYLSDIYTAEQIRGNEQTEAIEEMENINLGLVEREQPDLALVEDVDNARITLNGYEHTYRYSQRFENPGTFNESTGLEGGEDGFNVAVKFGNKYGSQSYTREIYSSDIVYNMQDGNEGKLGVYITYKISIRNEATTLRTRANEIVNYFDERYDINKITTEDGQELQYNVDDSYNNNGYRRVFIENDETLRAQSQEIIYIEYKLQNDAINAVLNEDVTLNSVTEVTSYSTFSDDNSTPYGGVDKDSRPGSAEPQTRTTYEDDTDRAPSFVLTVKEGRMIKGTVWEDNARGDLLEDTDVGFNRERKGDGLYNTGENKVGNVLVELLNINGDSYSVATLYKFNSETGNTYTESASMYTGSSGDYEFSGVIPGNYLIRYTYGNQSVIYDSNGNRIMNVEISNYKSTIYRGGDKAAAEAMTDYWYRAETGDAQRLSDAKDEVGINEDGSTFDIVNDRTTEEEINYGTSLENDKLENIQANTRRFDIKLDYDVNLDNISQYGADLKFVFDNIDLGIIRRPIQDLIITKEISHVQVVLANGQVIIDGDPRGGNLQYVRFLPDGNIHIEIDSELLQGATINITYAITVDNTRAEIDYNNEDYYIYGIVPNNNAGWKLATVTRLLDYLSNGLTYDEVANSGLWEEFKLDGSMVGTYFSEEAYNALKKYNRIFQTDEFATMEPGQIKSVELKASRVLSNNAEDFNFDNDIEVNTLKDKKIDNSTPGNYVPGDNTTYENDDDTVNIVITGPTGENRNYLPYVLLGISSFIIIAAGVIFIKKKVL